VIFQDDEHHELWFSRCVDGSAVDVCVKADGGEASFRLDLLGLPDVIREMCEKAGTTAPVMLGRPDIDPGKVMVVGPLAVWREEDGRVGFMPSAADAAAVSGAWRLNPAATRQFAAVLVAYADAEPGEDEVADLAEVLAADRQRAGHPHELDLHTARVVLRAGYRRGAS